MRRLFSLTALLAAAVLMTATAQAHFLWIVGGPQAKDGKVHVYFSEEAEPDDPDLIDKILAAKVFQVDGKGGFNTLKAAKGADSLEAVAGEGINTFGVACEYGVMSRGNSEPYKLVYFGRNQTLDGKNAPVASKDQLPLELFATEADNQLVFNVIWQGKPLEGAEVTAQGPGIDDKIVGTTDAAGQFKIAKPTPGLYSIRTKTTEAGTGEFNGKKYSSIRDYATLSLTIPGAAAPAAAAAPFPALPQGITSFGGAVAGNTVYVYGGHAGGAHHYAKTEQANKLLRLNLDKPTEWEVLGEGPGRTGLAMVAIGDDVYRIGGFEARNDEGQPDDLHSSRDFAHWNTRTKAWEAMPELPQGRSSHDAAVLNGTIYVVGGWELQGNGEKSMWHTTALKFTPGAPDAAWQEIAPPPFERRALSIAAFDGKLYAFGGMQKKGGPTTKVAIYDAASNTWSEGPSLPGKGMDGFGTSSFACGKNLYVSVMSGKTYKLSADGKQWDEVFALQHPRFFHRMLPKGNDGLLFIGGASMENGKATETEWFAVSQ